MDFLNAAAPIDDFSVDDLLDFSKIEYQEEHKDNNIFSFFSESQKTEDSVLFPVPETELFLPADDVEDLEWLSEFVDDTISGCSLPLPVLLKNQSKPEPVRTKARSKRAKTGGRVWSFRPQPPSQPPQPRRCSHCHVQKTPQWRAGPLGSKTLCNACGVRFKSGRLLPEYRPASSPTFLREVHSNNHRKVLEMRRKKESEPEPGSNPV